MTKEILEIMKQVEKNTNTLNKTINLVAVISRELMVLREQLAIDGRTVKKNGWFRKLFNKNK